MATESKPRKYAPHTKRKLRLNPNSDTPESPRRSVRFPDVVDEELEALSRQTGLTVSKLIRQAVDNYLAETRQKAS